MRILVTGGTGFIGSHIVAALVERGHDVHLLVRNPDGIARSLEPQGVRGLSFTEGDVTDAAAVERSMQGCDAALHAASVYSLDVRQADVVRRVNVAGTEIVLETATRLGLDPVVYISTLLAMLPVDPDEVLTPETSIKRPSGAYLETKAEADLVARGLQEHGSPVVIVYPGAVFGPDDPHFGESAQSVKDILAGRARFAPVGGFSIVDVRDVAAACAGMFEPGRGSRRYLLSGTNMPYSRLINTLGDITGRRIRHVTLPGPVLRPFVMLAGLLQRVLPFRLPVNMEGFQVIVWDPAGDDSRAEAELGFRPREVTETLTDVVRWMLTAGHISAEQAGRISGK